MTIPGLRDHLEGGGRQWPLDMMGLPALELTAAVAPCTRPAPDQGSQYSTTERVEAGQPQLLTKGLLTVGGF